MFFFFFWLQIIRFAFSWLIRCVLSILCPLFKIHCHCHNATSWMSRPHFHQSPWHCPFFQFGILWFSSISFEVHVVFIGLPIITYILISSYYHNFLRKIRVVGVGGYLTICTTTWSDGLQSFIRNKRPQPKVYLKK